MKHILSYQDEEGSFGSILANIQVTPSLLGESLISLKNYTCPVGKKRLQDFRVHTVLCFSLQN